MTTRMIETGIQNKEAKETKEAGGLLNVQWESHGEGSGKYGKQNNIRWRPSAILRQQHFSFLIL